VRGGGGADGPPGLRVSLALLKRLKMNRTIPETSVIRKNVNAKNDRRPRIRMVPRARIILVLRGICELKFIDW